MYESRAWPNGPPIFPPLPLAGEGGGEGQPCEPHLRRLYNRPVTALLWFWLLAGSDLLLPEGRPAPPLEGQTLDGRAWAETLTGQLTVVEFFATWCPKCRHSLADQHRLTASRRVRLIIVDVDEDPTLVHAFFNLNPPPAGAGVLVDQAGRAQKNWGVTGFPSMYVIDEKGIIRASFAGWGERSAIYLAKQIDELQGAEQRSAAAAAKKGPKPAAANRRGRGKAPPPARERTLGPDEHARQLGVEVLR